MKHFEKIAGLALSVIAALSMTAPALASDYSFTTSAPRNFYGSTSYEDVYGAQYNYNGRNVVDYQIPELEYGQPSTTMTGVMERTILPRLQETVASPPGSAYSSLPADAESSLTPPLLISPLKDSFAGSPYGAVGYGIGGSFEPTTVLTENSGVGSAAESVLPIISDTPQLTMPATPAFTSVSGMVRSDGSIGTLSIPKLGINVKVWEGETATSMAKGLGHYSSTSGWDGNIGVCGHNRGARYSIGAIKNLSAGDLITYTTAYGTRTYQITMVKVISYTDWSYLQSTADNRITLTTCVNNQPPQRICVQAVEKSV